jgi:Family of unknown function (DUF6644)
LLEIREVLKGIEKGVVGHWVAESAWAFNATLMLHMIAVAMVFGLIAIVDLRLIGLTSRKTAITELCRDVIPWTWVAFAISAVTGCIIFTGQAVKYFDNYAFRMKFLVMVLAGINMLVFQFIIFRNVATWDREAPAPLAAKLAGLISLICWIVVVAFGRWTAYFIA